MERKRIVPVHANVDEAVAEELATEATRYLELVHLIHEEGVPRTVQTKRVGVWARVMGPEWRSEAAELGELEPPCPACHGLSCDECRNAA